MLLSNPVQGAASYFTDREVHKPPLSTLFTLCPVFHAESNLAVVTDPAEVTLGDAAHVHLVRSLSHLEDTEVTSRAFVTVRHGVFLMVDNDRSRACLTTSRATGTSSS